MDVSIEKVGNDSVFFYNQKPIKLNEINLFLLNNQINWIKVTTIEQERVLLNGYIYFDGNNIGEFIDVFSDAAKAKIHNFSF